MTAVSAKQKSATWNKPIDVIMTAIYVFSVAMHRTHMQLNIVTESNPFRHQVISCIILANVGVHAEQVHLNRFSLVVANLSAISVTRMYGQFGRLPSPAVIGS